MITASRWLTWRSALGVQLEVAQPQRDGGGDRFETAGENGESFIPVFVRIIRAEVAVRELPRVSISLSLLSLGTLLSDQALKS
jgi:hypothetical protein